MVQTKDMNGQTETGTTRYCYHKTTVGRLRGRTYAEPQQGHCSELQAPESAESSENP